MSYTTNEKFDATPREGTVGMAIGIGVGMTMLLILIIYACYRKKIDNAVGPAPEEDDMPPYRSHMMYMVGDQNASKNGHI